MHWTPSKYENIKELITYIAVIKMISKCCHEHTNIIMQENILSVSLKLGVGRSEVAQNMKLDIVLATNNICTVHMSGR